MTPDADDIDRFARDLARLAAPPAPMPARLAVAVSGGADSMALLLLASAAFPGRVRAATVDHKLRPEAAAEAAAVADVCAALGVPHATLEANVAAGGEGVQGEARRARYAALAIWSAAAGCAWLLTAHHADDQAETLLMRLARGSGIGGLAGIRALRPLSPAVTLARPLLAWTRAELAAVVKAAEIGVVDDPSNRDMRFDRVRMRGWLDGANLDARALARSAAALAEGEAALAWAAEQAWEARALLGDGAVTLDPAGLPDELRRRLLLRALAELAQGAAPRGEELQRLLATLAGGGTATLAGVKCAGGDGAWRLESAPSRRR